LDILKSIDDFGLLFKAIENLWTILQTYGSF